MGARTTTPEARADSVRTVPIKANTVRNSGIDLPSRHELSCEGEVRRQELPISEPDFTGFGCRCQELSIDSGSPMQVLELAEKQGFR